MSEKGEIISSEQKGLISMDEYEKMYKSVFYAMKVTQECKSLVLSKKVLVDMDELNCLYYRICEKFNSQYKIKVCNVSVDVSFGGKKSYSFVNWEDFSSREWYETEPITSIVIKWEYHLELPDCSKPQPHVLVIKISDGLKPEQFINLVFTGNIENIEKIEEEIYPVVARVDYVNYGLGDELLNIVKDWNDGLSEAVKVTNRTMKFLSAHKKKISWISKLVMKILVVFVALLVTSLYLSNLGIDTIGKMTIDGFRVLLMYLFVTFFAYSVTAQLANFLLDSYMYYISKEDLYHVFNIDKGDEKLKHKYEEDTVKKNKKAVISLVVSVIINVCCGILSSIIAKKVG